MSHNRKLVLSAVSLTQARNKSYSIAVMGEIMNEIEQLMISTGFVNNAPFKWIGLTIRDGLKNDDKPEYSRIDSRDGELPIAIELDTHDLQNADRNEFKRLYKLITLTALIDVGCKYDLPVDEFVKRKEQLMSDV